MYPLSLLVLLVVARRSHSASGLPADVRVQIDGVCIFTLPFKCPVVVHIDGKFVKSEFWDEPAIDDLHQQLSTDGAQLTMQLPADIRMRIDDGCFETFPCRHFVKVHINGQLVHEGLWWAQNIVGFYKRLGIPTLLPGHFDYVALLRVCPGCVP